MSDAIWLLLLFLIYLGSIVALSELYQMYFVKKKPKYKFMMGKNEYCTDARTRNGLIMALNKAYGTNVYISQRKSKNRNKANETRQLNLQRFRKAPILRDKQFCEIVNEIEVD